MTPFERARWRLYNDIRMAQARHGSKTIQAWFLAIVAVIVYAIAAGSMK